MANQIPNLEEFRSSFREVSIDEACKLIGIDDDYFEGAPTVAVMVNDDGNHIEDHGEGWFHVLFEREEYLGDWDTISRVFYFEWVVTENYGPDDRTQDNLSTLLTEWSAYKGVPPACAMEMLHDDRVVGHCDQHEAARRRVWLEWFIEAWEACVDRDDKRLHEGAA